MNGLDWNKTNKRRITWLILLKRNVKVVENENYKKSRTRITGPVSEYYLCCSGDCWNEHIESRDSYRYDLLDGCLVVETSDSDWYELYSIYMIRNGGLMPIYQHHDHDVVPATVSQEYCMENGCKNLITTLIGGRDIFISNGKNEKHKCCVCVNKEKLALQVGPDVLGQEG